MKHVDTHTGELTRIRPAGPGDIFPMADLLAELFAIETDFSVDRSVQHCGLRLLMEDPEQAVVLVAEAEGTVVGMITVQVLVSTAEGGPVGLVEDLVVAETWRGRGLGTALLEAAELWARGRGLLRLQLLADRDNQAGLEFYAARNWSRTLLLCLRRIDWKAPET